MSKRALVVGERVRVYCAASRVKPMEGEITKIHGGLIDVRIGSQSSSVTYWSGYPQQCRRLKPKPQKERGERLECWTSKKDFVRIPPLNTGFPLVSRGKLIGEQYVHLLEVSELEVPVSRDALAKAWDSTVVGMARADHSPNSASFDRLCEKLGLVAPKKGLP